MQLNSKENNGQSKNMDSPRIFIDTNVWFSKLYGSENCEKIIKAHVDGRVQAVVSREVLSEIIKNVKGKLPLVFPSWQRLLTAYPPEVIIDPDKIPKKIGALVHHKDQGIFTAAVLAKVSYFVTGNIKDFNREKLERLTKIKILTPTELVAFLKL